MKTIGEPATHLLGILLLWTRVITAQTTSTVYVGKFGYSAAAINYKFQYILSTQTQFLTRCIIYQIIKSMNLRNMNIVDAIVRNLGKIDF